MCALLLHLRLFAAFCYKADTFYACCRPSKEVEQELGNECDAPGELRVMFHSDVLASRLERFDSKAIN